MIYSKKVSKRYFKWIKKPLKDFPKSAKNLRPWGPLFLSLS